MKWQFWKREKEEDRAEATPTPVTIEKPAPVTAEKPAPTEKVVPPEVDVMKGTVVLDLGFIKDFLQKHTDFLEEQLRIPVEQIGRPNRVTMYMPSIIGNGIRFSGLMIAAYYLFSGIAPMVEPILGKFITLPYSPTDTFHCFLYGGIGLAAFAFGGYLASSGKRICNIQLSNWETYVRNDLARKLEFQTRLLEGPYLIKESTVQEASNDSSKIGD